MRETAGRPGGWSTGLLALVLLLACNDGKSPPADGAAGTGGTSGGRGGTGGSPPGTGGSGGTSGAGGSGGTGGGGSGGALSDGKLEVANEGGTETGVDAGAPANCPEKRMPGDYAATPADDLGGLRDVTHVEGNLRILRTTGLADLANLRCLRSVGYDLQIEDNRALRSLGGLGDLRDVGGSISLARNDLLKDMAALAGLTMTGARSLTASIDINDNPRLAAVRLDGLVDVPGSLRIEGNNALQDLQGLLNVQAVGRQFFVRGNFNLRGLRGTAALKSVGAKRPGSIGVPVRDLDISDNPKLPQCEVKMLHDRLVANGFMGEAKIDRNEGTCP